MVDAKVSTRKSVDPRVEVNRPVVPDEPLYRTPDPSLSELHSPKRSQAAIAVEPLPASTFSGATSSFKLILKDQPVPRDLQEKPRVSAAIEGLIAGTENRDLAERVEAAAMLRGKAFLDGRETERLQIMKGYPRLKVADPESLKFVENEARDGYWSKVRQAAAEAVKALKQLAGAA